VFRQVEVTVDVGETIVFRFATPLSITILDVSSPAGESVWKFIAEELQPVETVGGSFQSWPIDEAPPEMLAMFEMLQKRADQELAEHGPRKPPLTEVTYGVLPAGYREDSAALPLTAGEYSVSVFGEQGQGSARFTI
jgi:hypothetical protein